jgi:hypothetical protein
MRPKDQASYCAKLDEEIARLLGIDETDVCCDYIPETRGKPARILLSTGSLIMPAVIVARGLLQSLRRQKTRIDAYHVLADRSCYD